MTIAPDRLAQLDGLDLMEGGHAPGSGCFCFNEAVAFVASEPHSARPTCESPVLTRFTTVLNDRWNDERRQLLKPYVTRVIGTAGDGKDEAREAIAAQFLTERLLGPWLRLAGMNAEADSLVDLVKADPAARRRAIYAIRDAAWQLRRTKLDELRKDIETRIREQLKAEGKPAVGVAADAVAAAVAADAAGDAVVAAAAADVAAVVAVAVVAVAADAAAAVVAVAVAAVAVAVAAAADVAVAVADVADSTDPWGKGYSAAYRAARKYFDEHPLPIADSIAELAASQQDLALELLDKMIDPEL